MKEHKKLLDTFVSICSLQSNFILGNTNFLRLSFKKGDYMEREVTRGKIVAIIQGKINIKCNHLWHNNIGDSEFFVLTKYSSIAVNFLEDTRLLLIQTESFVDSYEMRVLNTLIKISDQYNYNMDSLLLCPSILNICKQIMDYMDAGVMSRTLAEIKRMELFYNLLSFYTEEQLAHLFYPVLSNFSGFRSFIFNNYKRVKSVKELVALSYMSKSLFYKRFMDEFHISAKQWLLQKKLEEISYKASLPDMTVKRLMMESECNSLPQFNNFCKRYFQSELIKKEQSRCLLKE